MASSIPSLEDFKRRVMPSNPDIWPERRRQRIEQWMADKLDVHPAEKTKSKRELDFEVSRQYLQYCDRTTKEARVIKEKLTTTYLMPIFTRLCKLSEIKIMNGNFSISDGSMLKEKPADPYDRSLVPAPSGTLLFARGEGLWEEDLPSGLLAQHAFEISIMSMAHGLKKLEVNHAPWQAFQPSTFFKGRANGANRLRYTLTTLSMTLTNFARQDMVPGGLCRQAMKMGTFRAFIDGLQTLKDLTILMPCEFEEAYLGAVNLSHVVPANKTGLRKLSLENFEMSESYMINLLGCNRKTLRTLSLHDMYLVPQGSWV